MANSIITHHTMPYGAQTRVISMRLSLQCMYCSMRVLSQPLASAPPPCTPPACPPTCDSSRGVPRSAGRRFAAQAPLLMKAARESMLGTEDRPRRALCRGGGGGGVGRGGWGGVGWGGGPSMQHHANRLGVMHGMAWHWGEPMCVCERLPASALMMLHLVLCVMSSSGCTFSRNLPAASNPPGPDAGSRQAGRNPA